MNLLTAQLVDETHAECVERAQRLRDMTFRPAPEDQDAHVTAWEAELWELAEQIAWLRRQKKDLLEGY